MNNFLGLSEKGASEILKRDGYNELPTQKRQSNLSILFHILSEPMFLLLSVSGTIYLFMGELKDALVLLISIFVVVGITFYQERKTEKTLDALRSISSPRALVLRDGKHRIISGREVVRGDIIILREGDRIPADAYVLSCQNLSVDEALLTGESVPVRKSIWDGERKHQRPGGDDLPFVYSGTLVVSGRGMAQVYSTSLSTEMGKIGKSLETIKTEVSLLHKETGKIVRLMGIIGLFLCVLVVVLYIYLKGNVIGGLLTGLTLSMAILPEEFPVVLVIFLSLGAWRISKRKVLTRHFAAIETLGAATVLCTDKTGTLTLNKMELTSLYTHGSYYEVSNFASTELPHKFMTLLEYGILASQKDAFDPIEKELNKMGELYLDNSKYLHNNWQLVKEYPLSRHLLALSHAWKRPGIHGVTIATKGAPEAIIKLCRMSHEEKSKLLLRVKEMSVKGLRVLGVAKASSLSEELPNKQQDFEYEFVGLFGFIDPPRSTAHDSVKEAYEAGMRVIVVTGDYPGTASFIARKIGILNPDSYITGDELMKMDILELREKIKTINIFARVMPEQKLAIVNALKANGEIVAMTGDGVNDAPALKSAHIGIAMGKRGTDVAREASSLVLLNDDFSAIVSAVRLGRRIFNNLKRAMGYIMAVHVPIAGMSLLPLIFNMPIVLFPAHIAFMELIIDPACSTVFEAEKEDEGIMSRPPRNLHKPMFGAKTVMISLLQGFGILLVTFALFVLSTKFGKSELEARSFAFTSLVLSNLMLIVVNLSWNQSIYQILRSGNRTLLIVVVGAILSLLVVLYMPFFSDLFHMAPLNMFDFLLVGIMAGLSLAWFEILKVFRNTPLMVKVKTYLT